MLSLSRPILLLPALLALASISVAQADVVGTHHVKGTLNVTFNKQNQNPVKSVAELDENWTFNADHSFSRGTVNGEWLARKDGLIEVKLDRDELAGSLIGYWSDLGVVADHLHVSKDKLLLREVANGLSIEETLVYNMDVAENGGKGNLVPAKVSVSGTFSAIAENANALALEQMFPAPGNLLKTNLTPLSGKTTTTTGYTVKVTKAIV
jgi:hypothetical protein